MLKRLIIIFILMQFIVSCNRDSVSERTRIASTANKIHIAIVDSSNTPSRFVDGVKMAIEELNENLVAGKPVKALYYDDKGSLDIAQKIAWEIADNPKIVAVIGHFSSKIALSTSITYEKNGIIFITPKASISDLIRDRNKYTFRNIPSDNVMAQEMAKFAHRREFKKMSIIYERESFGKRLAEIFQKYGDQQGIKFVSVKSYTSWEKDFRPLISDLLNDDPFDALLICGNLPTSAFIVKQLRDMGINVPIIGSDSMDSMQLLNIAGKSADGVSVPTVFDPKIANNFTRYFVENFKYYYGFEPDTLAAQGYDAIKVLGHAIEKGGTPNPIVLSTNLRFLKNWQGVTGSYSFTQQGNIIDKSIYFKSVQKDKFVFIEREFNTDIKVSKPVKDIALRLPVKQIDTIDPIKISHPVSVEIVEQLFMGLTDIHPEIFSPIPALATHWVSKDNCKKWIFHLRKDVYWTDGLPVTAYDVEKTIKRNLCFQKKSQAAHLLNIIKNAKDISNGKNKDLSILGVKALDKYSIEFVLEHEAAYFPTIAGLWMFRPLPLDIINKHGLLWTEPKNIKTNGSYKLHVWEKGIQMVLRKNSKFCDAKSVSIPEIHYYVIYDPVLSLSMYYNQELDILGGNFSEIPSADISNISSNPFLTNHYEEFPILCSDVFIFNLDKNPVDSVLVRKAIAFASNRNLMIDSLKLNTAKIANTFVPDLILALKTQNNKIAFAPLKAQQSLSEAGYHNGSHFPEISIGFEDTEHNKNLSQTLKTLLNHYLNIKVKLHPIKKLSQNNFNFHNTEIMHIRQCGEYPDPSSWLNTLNLYGIKNSKILNILNQASKISNQEKRRKLYIEAERILTEEVCAIIPVYYQKERILIHPRVEGWYHMPFGGQHIRNWRLNIE
ncbi:Bacterial extracellular solute-binding protein, family 5 [Candidatus Magnetomorum sp. HK-1]|nr:Bacterial extracellular solute-binding protein, family 5 [Candidatus Magnetomorum sp. HK-1]